MSSPKVSVIMSVYNGMPFLEDAVRSILNQTYKNFEFIIVDDASVDNSWDYLKSLRDRRIKLIKNRANLGLAASLNIALRQAQGDFVARMDADDSSSSKRLEKQYDFMEKNPQVDLCGTWADLINEKGKVIGEKKFPSSDHDIKKILMFYSSIIHPTFFAKKDFFKRLGGYDKNFEYAEDYAILLNGLKKSIYANIPEKLFFWRLWEGRRSRAAMEKIDRADFKVKFEALKKGTFPKFYFVIVLAKFFITYLTPYYLKIKIAKLAKMA